MLYICAQRYSERWATMDGWTKPEVLHAANAIAIACITKVSPLIVGSKPVAISTNDTKAPNTSRNAVCSIFFVLQDFLFPLNLLF